jgi:transposase
VLGPTLTPGDVVVMDHLSAHKVAGIRELVQARGPHLLYLPPYSPHLNPIEPAWSKFQQFLRAAKIRSQEALDQAVTEALKPSPQTMLPHGCRVGTRRGAGFA